MAQDKKPTTAARRADENLYDENSPVVWEQYEKLRPHYPDALYDTITQYLKEHNQTQKELCVDYGTGSGSNVPGLLSRCGIQKVLGTDLTARQLTESKPRLQATFGKDRYDIMVGGAGDLTSIPDSSVDVVSAAESMHWFQQRKWLQEAARILKPSGTLVFWHYPAEPCIVSHPDATPPMHEAFRELYWSSIAADGGFPRTPVVASVSELDSFFVSPSTFRDQIRHKWQLPRFVPYQVTSSPFTCVLESPLTEIELRAGLSATPHTKVTSHVPRTTDQILLRRKDWTMENIKDYMKSLGAEIDEDVIGDRFVRALKDVERIVGGPNAKFDVGWPMTLVMATRS